MMQRKPCLHLLRSLAYTAVLSVFAMGAQGALADGDPLATPAPSAKSTHPQSKASTAKASTVRAEKPAPTRDPLAVDPQIAVKDTPIKEIVLPGVMKIAGDSLDALDPGRAKRISMTNGGSQTVWLSATEPNRIQLPFNNPHIVSTTDVQIDKRANSNNVYVSFVQGLTRPVQVFFEPADGGVVLGLQLVPKGIPSQTILVSDDSSAHSGGTKPKTASNSEYSAQIQSLMEIVALGGVPNGYSKVPSDLPVIVMDGLVVEVDQRMSSRTGDIYVYQVSNPGKSAVMVREDEFDDPSVAAISIFPKPLLAASEKARVLVMTRKLDARGN